MYDNPIHNMNRYVDPKTVNCMENRAFVEDRSLQNPIYASIGKSAVNPLYQESFKRNNETKADVKAIEEEERKLEEKEATLVNIFDANAQPDNQQYSNVYDPNVHDKNDKNYDKENIDF